jgi:hypothetical protein
MLNVLPRQTGPNAQPECRPAQDWPEESPKTNTPQNVNQEILRNKEVKYFPTSGRTEWIVRKKVQIPDQSKREKLTPKIIKN